MNLNYIDIGFGDLKKDHLISDDPLDAKEIYIFNHLDTMIYAYTKRSLYNKIDDFYELIRTYNKYLKNSPLEQIIPFTPYYFTTSYRLRFMYCCEITGIMAKDYKKGINVFTEPRFDILEYPVPDPPVNKNATVTAMMLGGMMKGD